jgi:hypothetical protein
MIATCSVKTPARVRLDQASQGGAFSQLALMALDTSVCRVQTKRVACKMPTPIGVGTEIRNGTKSRVPARGASHISILRSSCRYLTA